MAIMAFVQASTSPGAKFVAPEERIATFDQDGTLWVEHPVYSQLMFVWDRVPTVVEQQPELANVDLSARASYAAALMAPLRRML